MGKIRGFILLAIYLAAGLFIPFGYETMTLWYKTGTKRFLLHAGQYIGMATLMSIYIQVILANRGDYLEKLFGAGNLIKWHRRNGIFLLFLASFHSLCILIPEGISNLPIGWKFWPELVGASAIIMIALMVITTQFRQKFKIPYPVWKTFHKIGGYLIALSVSTHALFVSESFEQTYPRIFLLISFALLTYWIIHVGMQKK